MFQSMLLALLEEIQLDRLSTELKFMSKASLAGQVNRRVMRLQSGLTIPDQAFGGLSLASYDLQRGRHLTFLVGWRGEPLKL